METRRTRRWEAEERAATSARGEAWGLAGSDWSEQPVSTGERYVI